MAQITVSPAELAALATSMDQVADDLQWCAGHVRDDAWSLGPGESAGALEDVLGDMEHQRLRLGRSLGALASAVRAAGRAYARVEVDAVPAEAAGP